MSISAQRVGFFNIRSGPVLDKILGIGSGRSVEIYDQVYPGIFFTLRYFGYFRVCQVFTGIYGYYLRVFTGILDIISYLVEVSKLLKFDECPGDLEGIHANI